MLKNKLRLGVLGKMGWLFELSIKWKHIRFKPISLVWAIGKKRRDLVHKHTFIEFSFVKALSKIP